MIKIKKFGKDMKNMLTGRLRLYLVFLYMALIVAALLELIGLGSVPVFVSILLDPHGSKEFFGIDMNIFFKNFLFFENTTLSFALLIVFIFLFKTFFLFFTYLFELRILRKIKIDLSEKLLRIYIFKPYIFFVNKNSAELSRNLITEVDNSVGFIQQIINFSRESSILLIIFFLLILFDPLISISGFIILSVLGISFYLGTEKFLEIIRAARLRSIGEVFKSLFLSFGAIKDLKVYKKENFFIEKFIKGKKIYETNLLWKELIVKAPRLFFELFGVIFIITVTVFFIYSDREMSKLLPVLALIGVSTIRLMPSFTTISHSLAYLKFWKNSFDLVAEEMSQFNKNFKNTEHDSQNLKNISETDKAIEVKNLSFLYPGENQGVSINNISLDIQKGEMIGIIGKSGAGKSTLANIILNLLTPLKGKINIYNTKSDSSIKKDNRKQAMAYIPQDIFLMDDTLKRNVAFGEYDEDIVETKVIEALKDAELFEFVKKHPKRLDLIIGERGIRLSGGERQRLGIARALYRDPEILVMDEATSSLDNFTEQQIMNSIKKLRKKHTIIMIAHRLSTIRSCDRVYLIENGVIKDFGQLDKLLERYPYLNSYQDNEK